MINLLDMNKANTITQWKSQIFIAVNKVEFLSLLIIYFLFSGWKDYVTYNISDF